MYAADPEGGTAVILISPGGQTMLVDAGFPQYNGRDASRIEEAAKAAGRGDGMNPLANGRTAETKTFMK